MKKKTLGTIVGLGLAAVTVIACAGGGTTGSGQSSGDQAAQQSQSQPSASAAAPKPANGKPNDKGWVLESHTVSKDGLGQFEATARVTNTNTDPTTATFTITLFKAGKQVASLQGAANGVSPGRTVTVQLMSTENYVAGPFTVDFQVDVSF